MTNLAMQPRPTNRGVVWNPDEQKTVEVRDDFGAPHSPDGTPSNPGVAPPAPEAINWKDPSWASQGVDFNKIESGAPVPGQPGKTFVHTGTGWAIQGSAPTAAPAPAGQPGAPAAPSAAPNPSSDPAPAPNAGSTTIPGQTTSTTPTAAPVTNTANQGGQDVYRNALIAQMAQDEVPDINDKAIKAQLDPARAEATRMMRGDIRSEAEAAFAGDQDFGAPERVAAQERAGNQIGLKAADIMGRELTARRAQIESALKEFGSTMEADQRRALELKLAQIKDATDRYGIDKDYDVRKEGIAQTGRLGGRELDIREKLGLGGLNIDLINTMMGNQQANNRLGFDIGSKEADLNERAMRAAMGI